MTITATDASLLGTPNDLRKAYCVYEHYMGDMLIYIGATKLINVAYMSEARDNSEWSKITDNGNLPVTVRIIATGPVYSDIRNYAVKHMKSFNPMPRCNMHGFDMHRASRRLACSNGLTYNTQMEAARVLGVSQSAISQHLKGTLPTVRGLTFNYVNEKEPTT